MWYSSEHDLVTMFFVKLTYVSTSETFCFLFIQKIYRKIRILGVDNDNINHIVSCFGMRLDNERVTCVCVCWGGGGGVA